MAVRTRGAKSVGRKKKAKKKKKRKNKTQHHQRRPGQEDCVLRHPVSTPPPCSKTNDQRTLSAELDVITFLLCRREGDRVAAVLFGELVAEAASSSIPAKHTCLSSWAGPVVSQRTFSDFGSGTTLFAQPADVEVMQGAFHRHHKDSL